MVAEISIIFFNGYFCQYIELYKSDRTALLATRARERVSGSQVQPGSKVLKALPSVIENSARSKINKYCYSTGYLEKPGLWHLSFSQNPAQLAFTYLVKFLT
jgi:hypothetical protein